MDSYPENPKTRRDSKGGKKKDVYNAKHIRLREANAARSQAAKPPSDRKK